MGKYLTETFVDDVHALKTDLNLELGKSFAPMLGASEDEYDRTETFVAMNEWLRDATKDDLKRLSGTFGLLPVIYSLSGIDVLQATLLQETARLDVMGIISYIRTALHQLVGNDVSMMRTLCRTMFPDYDTDAMDVDSRSLFISLFISKCMNTRSDITYPQAISRVLMPVLEG